MFGLFKKKPANAMEALIFALYGNPPPPKRAQLATAITLASDELLLGLIDRDEIVSAAKDLNDGPIPYSTEDLAISVALSFFMKPELIPKLAQAQLIARMKALEWFEQQKVPVALLKSFENTLYRLYKT